MRFCSRILSLGRNLFRRKKVERELSDEITSHLELLVVSNLREGLSESEARRAALLELGGVEQLKEEIREAHTGYRVATLLQDLHYAGRFLLKHRFFSASTVLTLALGFGISIAMFCLVKVVWIRPLNYPDADGLLQISAESPVRGLHEADVSFPRFEQIRSRKDLFAEVAALTGEQLTLIRDGKPEQINAAHISDGFFRMLGTQPVRGRLFLSTEHRATGAQVALISFSYWQDRFAGDPNVVGQRVTLGGASSTIVGILPRGFSVPFGDFKIYLPRVCDVRFLAPQQIDRGAGFLKALARPQRGVAIGQVRSALPEIDRGYRNRAPGNMDVQSRSRVFPLREAVVRGTRPAIGAVTMAVICVMVLASINVANMLLGQLARREKEIAVRHALGAGHPRIVRQFISENFLLTAAALIFGISFAAIALAMVHRLGSGFLPGSELRLDVSAICFALVLAFVNALFFAVVSALHAPRDQSGETLRQAVGAGSGHPAFTPTRRFLLVTQITLSLVLAIAAALLIASWHRIQNVDLGFDPEDVFVADVSPASSRADAEGGTALVQRLIERLQKAPEVATAAAIYGLPLSHHDTFLQYATTDRPMPIVGNRATTWYRAVSPQYFIAMRIPLRIGRDFTAADKLGSQPVVILSETTARLLFGNVNPIGRKIVCGGTIQTTREVVGVVGDVRSLDLTQPVREEMYFPMAQCGEPAMTLIIRARSGGTRNVIEKKIRACLQELNAAQAVTATQPMHRVIARSVARGRFVAVALALFAGLALLVAITGIYSVMDYAVSQRTREIGVRLALGARRCDIIRLIVAGGMKLVSVGLAVGLLVALCCMRFLSELLYGVSATDPLVFGFVILLLAAVAFLANYFPARRAMRVAPLAALQYE